MFQKEKEDYNNMNKREMSLIAEVVTKLVLESIVPIIKKVAREEYKILAEQQSLTKPIKKVQRSFIDKSTYQNDFKEILEATRPKINLPSTGSKLLDDILTSAPTEEQLMQETEISQTKSTKQYNTTIPIEELYLNNVKNVTAELAENVDYSAFIKRMDNIKNNSGGFSLLPPDISSPTALYNKDKNSILQEQKIGQAKVERTFKA